MLSLVWLSFSVFVLIYTALLHDTDRDNVEWAWTLALFVLLVHVQCRTITLLIGWNSQLFTEENCLIECTDQSGSTARGP
jgi:hypothetical protein